MTWGSWGFGFVVAVLMGSAMPAFAQMPEANVDLGGHVAVVRLSEFDVTDTGVGIDATWRATPTISLDGALTWFPGNDDTGNSRVGRQQRVLGLAGIRSGVRRGRVELFGRARGGFLRFSALEGGV